MEIKTLINNSEIDLVVAAIFYGKYLDMGLNTFFLILYSRRDP